MLYFCAKFHENISNGFQLTKRTRVHGRNGYVQCSTGNNSKRMQTRVTVYVPALQLQLQFMMLYICMTFDENISDGIRVMERT